MSLPPSYFDDLYAATPDPWQFATRWYEQRKRAATMAALPRQRWRRGFEPGCSTGILSDLLAARCDELVCSDIAQAAVDATAARLALSPHVDVRRLAVPDEWPAGTFDLIVLSEVGYYFSLEPLARLVDHCVNSLEANGVLVACHWRHEVADYPISGDEVHACLDADARLTRTVRHVEQDFVLEVFGVGDARSVAVETGLI